MRVTTPWLLLACVPLLLAADACEPEPDPSGRSTVDRVDDMGGYQVHLIYAVPSDGVDRELDLDGSLDRSWLAINRWMWDQTGGSELRLDTFEGQADVSFAELPRTDAAYADYGVYLRNELEDDLEDLGFTHPQKIYVIYYEGTNAEVCGGAAWPPALMGTMMAIYLQGQPPGSVTCDSAGFSSDGLTMNYLEWAGLHDTLHVLGIVPTAAPNHGYSGHVTDDPRDLMYSGSQPWQPTILDIDQDDYYGHGVEGRPDLARSAFLDPSPAGAELPPGW